MTRDEDLVVVARDGTTTSGPTPADLPAAIRAAMLSGAAMVRGLDIRAAADLAGVRRALGVEPVAEREQFARRSDLGAGVYGASEWPAGQAMCVHQEQTYRSTVPALMLFGCVRAADDGGTMLLADSAEVLSSLPREVVARFERDGWMVVRNYNDDYIGLPWFEAFGTHDRSEIERYCRARSIEFEWRGRGLRTYQRAPAVVRHPVSGLRCWFNQAAFLNGRSLEPVVREVMLQAYGVDGLPFDTRYGDGKPIEPEVVETINDAFRDATTSMPMRSGDLLVVDNIRTAHGRQPYVGGREFVVAMTDPISVAVCDPVPTFRTGTAIDP